MLISYPPDIQRVLSNLVLQCLMWKPRQEWMTGAFLHETETLTWSYKLNISSELDCFLLFIFQPFS